MSLFSWILGAPKAAEKVVDAVVNTGDKLVFTEEEKADMRAKTRDWWLKYMEATQPQNLARRYGAVIIFGVWALLLLLGVGLQLGGLSERSKFVFQVMADHVDEPFMIVLAFYYGVHLLRGMKEK